MDDFGTTDETSNPQRKDLADLSLEEVQALRNKMGIKKFNKKYGNKRVAATHSSSEKKKRVTNARPLEISSKRPVNPERFALGSKKAAVSRDPRFDDLSGNYDEQVFKRSYKFIDRLKAKEMKAVRKIAEDEEMDDETRKKAKDMLTRLDQKKAAKKDMSAENKVEKALKRERKSAIKEGQKPFFLRASEKKKLILAEKYKELKKKGDLDSFMKKKRKHNVRKMEGAIPERTVR